MTYRVYKKRMQVDRGHEVLPLEMTLDVET